MDGISKFSPKTSSSIINGRGGIQFGGGSSDREILDSGVGCRVKFEDNDASNMSCRGKVGRLVASEEAFPVVKVEGDGEEEVIFASLDQLIAACEMCTRAGAKKTSARAATLRATAPRTASSCIGARRTRRSANGTLHDVTPACQGRSRR